MVRLRARRGAVYGLLARAVDHQQAAVVKAFRRRAFLERRGLQVKPPVRHQMMDAHDAVGEIEHVLVAWLHRETVRRRDARRRKRLGPDILHPCRGRRGQHRKNNYPGLSEHHVPYAILSLVVAALAHPAAAALAVRAAAARAGDVGVRRIRSCRLDAVPCENSGTLKSIQRISAYHSSGESATFPCPDLRRFVSGLAAAK